MGPVASRHDASTPGASRRRTDCRTSGAPSAPRDVAAGAMPRVARAARNRACRHVDEGRADGLDRAVSRVDPQRLADHARRCLTDSSTPSVPRVLLSWIRRATSPVSGCPGCLLELRDAAGRAFR